MPRLKFHHYLNLAIIGSMILIQPSTVSKITELNQTQTKPIVFLKSSPVPVLKEEADHSALNSFLDTLSAHAVYVTDEDSGAVLLEKNGQQQFSPASTTKLMTALVARETYHLGQVFRVKEESFTQGNVIDLSTGELISVQSLLQGLLISSGNDAAFVLANNHPGSYQGFIKDMNSKAKALGLNQTNFTNPSGLDGESHLMSARDLAILTREAMKDRVLREIMSSSSSQISDVSGEIAHRLFSTHQLINNDSSVVGGKTGTTELAGQVLVTQFKREGHNIMIVLMGSQDRYSETSSILELVLENYQWQEVNQDIFGEAT